MRLSRQLGVEVAPALSRADAQGLSQRVQSAVVTFAETGRLAGALRVPHAVAPIEVIADLRAGQVHCAVTVAAPKAGRPSTRVSWLTRQLRDAPAEVCIEATAAWQRGRASAKTLAEIRENPKVLVADPKRELRAFTVSLHANVGTKRGQGHGSFVMSVLTAVDRFYAEVVQHIKPWAQAPPKVKDDEPAPAGQAATADVPPAEIRGTDAGETPSPQDSAHQPVTN